jgi:hypothetical protein
VAHLAELGKSVALFQDTIIAGAPKSPYVYVFVKDSTAEMNAF